MNQVIEWRGKPQAIRVDNSPEHNSGTLIAWAEKQGVRLEYIQPGKPQQNACIEWQSTYNNEKANMGIGGIKPAMKLKTAA